MDARANPVAVTLFLSIVAVTLVITWLASRGTRSRSAFYAGSGEFSAFQNGLAIAGDYMSAAAFLGVSGLITVVGFDGMMYGIGFVMGWPIVLFLIAERLRRLGRFTFADALSTRLRERPIRIFTAVSSLTVIAFYLIAQMVGAGQLIELLFGVDYVYSVILVGVLMTCYVVFGGMVATTWIQIVKAVILLVGTGTVAVLTLARFGFNLSTLIDQAVAVHPRREAILAPGAITRDPVSGFSLGLALLLGTAGLPHILMRFFTVPDVRAARGSVWFACFLNAAFFLMVYVIGFGAVALVMADPAFLSGGGLRGGSNMAAIYLSQVVGGDVLMGVVSAVAFATILAVVAGLTLAGASAISHDLYAKALGRQDEGRELRVGRIASLAIGGAAIALGLAFRTQNVAYMVSLAFAIAASANFPILLLSMSWRGLTTEGALAGGIAGLVSSLGLTIVGPAIWVKTLGYAEPLFPYDPPAFLSVPLAFLVAWGVSRLTASPPLDLTEAGAVGLPRA
ncbi:sodium:solute symporter family transporter [Methylobacterium oryzisoli]|uniref:sodium:solute symporter family transporter n=1 Tax=Methylobacterium oryzisoli TaxID=3385502 RepID=UPI0038916C00